MKIFIGSSKEQKSTLIEVANIIEDNGHNPLCWNKPGLFKPGSYLLNRLIDIAHEVDAAIIIFAEDDKIWFRNDVASQPRDNVIFEHGIFTGILGVENSIILNVGNAKVASDLGGITLIDFSEGKKQRGTMELERWLEGLIKPAKPPILSINDFFYSLEDAYKTQSTFTELIQNAKKVHVLARTSVNLLGNYDTEIIQLIQTGAEVKFLFVSSDSEAAKYIYGNDSTIYVSNAAKTQHHLERIFRETKKQLEVRTIRYAPTLSLLYIEKNDGHNFITVQFYFHRSRISRDRPMFRLGLQDKWFTTFKDELDKLWDEADPWIF